MTDADTTARFHAFARLHVAGDPLVLFNVWDPGSARAAAAAGARAIATGSASVAAAFGHGDGEELPLDLVLANAARIVGATPLPTSIDFEGGYAAAPEDVRRNAAALRATGAIGCNFEDQRIGGDGLHTTGFQAERIASFRAGAGAAFFLNARTDLFLQAPRDAHDAALADAAIERAHAYAAAGADGFFVPGLVDLALLARICAASPLPVNYFAMPGGRTRDEVAAIGVARISHGPFPYRLAMRAFEEAARAALSG